MVLDQDQRARVARARSPDSMAESPEKRRIDSETSLEVSVEIGRDIAGGRGSISEEVEGKEVGNVGSLNNGGSSSPGL